MIYLLNTLVLFILTNLSLSFFPHLRIFGIVPLLPLFFVVLLSYFRKGAEPLILAALAGMFLDFFSPYPFGFYLMFFLVMAAVVRYFFGEGMKTLSFWYYLAICLISLTAYYIAQIAVLWGEGTIPALSNFGPVLVGLLVNSVFIIAIYAMGQWYFERVLILEDRLKRR